MIISGLQTGNTQWLAAHLQNAADNETIDLIEVSGTIARDIDGALAEFDAYTKGTRAKEGVYAAFINPPEKLTRDQYLQAISHIEDRLGLTGQPRIILFHSKKGREHCHIIWSRIDTARMKAIQLSHDRQKLRRCAQELAAEFGTELPPGLEHDRGAERFNDPPQPTRAEKAMEARSGLSREERRALITQCYRLTDSAQAFMNALEATGYMLAKGDKRAFVVVDTAGHVHSLARQIDGAKTKDVKKKLEGLTLSLLPPASRAKVLMLQRAAAQQDAARTHQKKKKQDKTALERLQHVQNTRRMELDLAWQKMKIRHMHERKVLLAHIKAKEVHRIARRHWLAVGLALYLKKIAVIRQLVEYYEKRRKRSIEQQHRLMTQGLQRRHDNEAAELRRRQQAIGRLERREMVTFEQVFTTTAETIQQQDRFEVRLPPHRFDVAVGPEDFASGRRKSVDMTSFAKTDVLARYHNNAADITGFIDPNPAAFSAHMAISKISVPLQQSASAHGDFRINAIDVTGQRTVNAAPQDDRGRGRDKDCSSPPAQIPACAANALGSSLGFWRRSGDMVRRAARGSAESIGRSGGQTYPR